MICGIAPYADSNNQTKVVIEIKIKYKYFMHFIKNSESIVKIDYPIDAKLRLATLSYNFSKFLYRSILYLWIL